MADTGADTTVVFVPPKFAKGAVIEAVDAGIGLAVVITEGIPVHDTASFWAHACATGNKTRIIGPNCPGVISPGKSNAGIIPADITGPGRIGLVSKSGTLTYQLMYELRDIGFSTAVGIGGDPIIGTTHIDALAAFEADPETELIVMIGEIGGDAEERAAAFIEDARHQAGRRLRRGLHRAGRQDHGPRGRHRVRLVRHRGREEGSPGGGRRASRQDSFGNRRAGQGEPGPDRRLGAIMRYDVNLSILFTELPMLERPAAAAAAGFDAVEMWWPFDGPGPRRRGAGRARDAPHRRRGPLGGPQLRRRPHAVRGPRPAVVARPRASGSATTST